MFETVILERENELNFIRYNELISLKFIPEYNESYITVPDKYELRTIYNNYVLTKEEYEMVKKWIEKVKCTTKLHLL